MVIQQTARTLLLCCAIFSATSPSSLFSADAFSAMESPSRRTTTTTTTTATTATTAQPSSRRDWFGQASAGGVAAIVAAVATTTTTTVAFPQAALAAGTTSTAEYVTELQTSLAKLQPIPKMLEEEKWDEVRTILKNPPVNKLWNLGDSQNTVLKLVKETGNVELFEIKDDLAYNLQMCDQYTYANNFIAFQPGNGKLKIKEPIEAINGALNQLDTIIKGSSE